MPKLVVHGAQIKCSQGSAPGSLAVLPKVGTTSTDKPAATVMDQKPMVNIQPFGLCQSMANPQVAAATAAAMGTLTPQTCVPVIAAPWSPGSSSMTFQQNKALTNDSKCMCNWGGSIEITQAGSDLEVT